MAQDFIKILTKCIASLDGGVLFGVVLLSLALGALCWIVCSYYTRLWHKRFHVRAKHHLLCAIAAIFTIIFTITYSAVGNLEYIVDDIIDNWHVFLTQDKDFHNETYELAFYTLQKEHPTVFRDVPEPSENGSYIPFSNDDMMQTCVEIYVNEACSNFSTQHPFLNMMLKARPDISQTEIEYDIKEFFQKNQGAYYPLERAIDIAANHIRANLLEQSPETVSKTRLILLILFLGVQVIPFGIIGYCAYKDLKINRKQK